MFTSMVGGGGGGSRPRPQARPYPAEAGSQSGQMMEEDSQPKLSPSILRVKRYKHCFKMHPYF